jgi:hypothetical protein
MWLLTPHFSEDGHDGVESSGLRIQRADGLCLCHRDCHIRMLSAQQSTNASTKEAGGILSGDGGEDDEDDRSWPLTVTKCSKCGVRGECAGGWALDSSGRLVRRGFTVPTGSSSTSSNSYQQAETNSRSSSADDEHDRVSAYPEPRRTATACLAKRAGFLFNEEVSELRPCNSQQVVKVVVRAQVTKVVDVAISPAAAGTKERKTAKNFAAAPSVRLHHLVEEDYRDVRAAHALPQHMRV